MKRETSVKINMKFDKKCGGEMLGVLEPLNITCLFREIERRLKIERIKIEKIEKHKHNNVKKCKNSNFLIH